MKKAKGKSDQTKESASPEKHRKGWFRTDAGTAVRFEADTPEDYDRAVEIIEAGFRARREAADWGMNPDDSWQLACFPMKHEDWAKRMELLLASKLGDPSSDTFDLEHSSTWIIKPLWNWLHEMALRAENPNYKRDAGRILGELYRQARQDKNEDRLSKENSEFKRAINPQIWSAQERRFRFFQASSLAKFFTKGVSCLSTPKATRMILCMMAPRAHILGLPRSTKA